MVNRDKLTVVCVTWHDAHTDTETWTPISDIGNDPCVVQTVGYLLPNAKADHVVIAQSFIDHEDQERDVDSVMCIPVGMVKAMVVYGDMSESTSRRASR